MRRVFLVLPVSLSLGISSLAGQAIEHPEWKSYFDASGVVGTIVVRASAWLHWVFCRPQQISD